MDALVLCGGRGTRLDADAEKPLFEVAGRPMVDAVLDALDRSRVAGVTAVTSPHAPETRAHLRERGAETYHAGGEGYVADLREALATVDPPVVTVAADLPLLAAEHVDRTLDAHDGRDRTVCVPAGLKAALDVSADTTRERDGRDLAPTGLNVVAGEGAHDGEAVDVRWDARLAVNVNRRLDADVAEVLAGGP